MKNVDEANDFTELLFYGAGSLRSAVCRMAEIFSRQTKIPVNTDFGPSGLLRERIEKGERPDLFASADMGHPMKLASDGLSGLPVMFAKNEIALLVHEDRNINTGTMLDRLIDLDLKIGAPKHISDPGGDYAREFFKKADAIVPGSSKIIEKKAVIIGGRPAAPKIKDAAEAIATCFIQGTIDTFVGYVSILIEVARLVEGLKIVPAPPQLAIHPEFGLTVLRDSKQEAYRLALFILSPSGQQILAEFGFIPVTLPHRRYDS